MKRWLLFVVSGVEALLVLAAVYCEPTLTVRGKLHGEAFFDGKSTSWWRREIANWSDVFWIEGRGRGGRLIFYHRKPTWFEQIKERGEQFWAKEPIFLGAAAVDPPLLRGDPQAEPVLRALLDDPSPDIRRYARRGLKLDKDWR
jgi:hypothetical protein